MNDKPNKLIPALYGGIVAGVISGLPFVSIINCFCCAGVMLGGVLAVFFYKKELPPAWPLTSGDAVQLGVLSGVFTAIISTILSVIIFLSLGNVTGQALYDFLVESGIMDQLPPETLEQMEEGLLGADISPVSIVISFIIDPLFGLLGGLIGYAMFKSKGQMAPMVPPPPPTMP